jgi:hypothetical protein|tara:strand:+ start:1198 stop:1359 length:162 start_codon:yes stop_codon:yes gene_type:complete
MIVYAEILDSKLKSMRIFGVPLPVLCPVIKDEVKMVMGVKVKSCMLVNLTDQL